VIYERETPLEKTLNTLLLEVENEERRAVATHHQHRARAALNTMGEADVNGRTTLVGSNTQREMIILAALSLVAVLMACSTAMTLLRLVVPWMKSLRSTTPILLEDGAPAHTSRIANDYLRTEEIDKLSWPGHSPEINAIEHAWPWMRRHISKNYLLSETVEQCKHQWERQNGQHYLKK
jgi:hypothetical protein